MLLSATADAGTRRDLLDQPDGGDAARAEVVSDHHDQRTLAILEGGTDGADPTPELLTEHVAERLQGFHVVRLDHLAEE